MPGRQSIHSQAGRRRFLKKILPALLPVSLGLLCLAPLARQEKFPDIKGPYFGQPEPGEKAEKFAPGLISIPGRYELAVSFSPNGDELLFSAMVPGKNMRIYHSRSSNGNWTEPQPVSLSEGAKKEEMEAFFSPDGKHIFFAPYDEGMDVRIWVLERGEHGWRRPRILGAPVSEGPAFFPTCSLNGTLYYTDLARRQVSRAILDGTRVVRVEDPGIALGGHPFIAPDESFVLVDSAAAGDPDQRDIFIAFRREDGTWTNPLDLGSGVNTDYFETCPSLSHDGRYIFFSRYDEPGEIADIYWIRSGLIDSLRRRAKGNH